MLHKTNAHGHRVVKRSFSSVVIRWVEPRTTIQYILLQMDGTLWWQKLELYQLREGQLGTQITPRGWIFWTMIFYNLKNSHQYLYNEGSNFILRSVEVTQIQPFVDKLPEIIDFVSYNNLRIGQDSEVLTQGIDNVKIDHALTFGMPKKVFSLVLQRLSEFVQHYQAQG